MKKSRNEEVNSV